MIFREKRRPGFARRRPARVLVCFALALRVLVARGLAGAARADDASEARRHAQRATSLAASGKCKQAVAEFDKALAVLRDPALLFNRAECHRKLGDADEAIDDYQKFLADLPRAPNRAEVEERIADLRRTSADAAASAASSTTDADEERPASASTGRPREERAGARAVPSPPSRANDTGAPREGILTAPPAAVDREHDRAAGEYPGGAIATASDTPASSSDVGLVGRRWFWIAVAVLAVGAGAGTFLLLNRDSTNVPSSALGNYRF